MHFYDYECTYGFSPGSRVSEIYKKLKFFPWEFFSLKILGSGDSRDPHFKIGILRSSVLTLGL